MNTPRHLSIIVQAAMAVALASILGVGIWLLLGEESTVSRVENLESEHAALREEVNSLLPQIPELQARDEELEALEARVRLVVQAVRGAAEICLIDDATLEMLPIADSEFKSELAGAILAVRQIEDEREALLAARRAGQTFVDWDREIVQSMGRVLSAHLDLLAILLAWMGDEMVFEGEHGRINDLRHQAAEVELIVRVVKDGRATQPEMIERQWLTADELRSRYAFAQVWFDDLWTKTVRMLQQWAVADALRPLE